MKTTTLKIALIVAATFMVQLANAQACTPAANAEDAAGQKATIFKELDCLNSENVILHAALNNAQLKKQIADIEAGKDADNHNGNGMPALPFKLQSLPVLGGEPKGPMVQLVSTSPKVNNGQPTATIQLPSGRTVSAVVGTKVPNVGTITQVSAQQVLYRTANGQESWLPFASDDSDSVGR